MNSDFQIVMDSVNEALDLLYRHDHYLIYNPPRGLRQRENHVSERGIVFRFGIYLEKVCKKQKFFDSYNIDAEYNRNFYEPKYLPKSPNGSYPDLIIHKRGSNDFNLLIIEFKTWWDNNNETDIRKIKEFMDLTGNYRYKFGLSVVLDKEKPICEWVSL